MSPRRFVMPTALLLTLCATACSTSIGGESEVADGEGTTVTIGYVSPRTGPLAAFGEADSYVIDEAQKWFAEHPLEIGGRPATVKIIVKDAQSDSTRAGQVAADLINKDGAQLILASSTPDIVNPVSEQCEANAVPCITTVAPWQTVALRGGGGKPAELAHTHHFFWGLEDVAGVYTDMWSKVETNHKAGGLFPNDPDGQAWSANFPALTKTSGVSITNPGLYPNGTKDFSAQVAALKGHDILVGVPVPPDFTTFWKQAKQQGYQPKIATIGKALLFPSVVEGLGDVADGLSTEVWWHPTSPFKSSLTQQSAAELSSAYEGATQRQWTQPLGFSHALFEVAAAALSKAGSTEPADLDKTLSSLSVDTIVGKVTWGTDGLPASIAKTPLTGGQWRRTTAGEHPFELVVVSNTLAPQVPVAGPVEPLS